MKVSDDQVLPVMTDLLAVPECLILSSAYGQFQLVIGLCQRKMYLPPCKKFCTNTTRQFDYDGDDD